MRSRKQRLRAALPPCRTSGEDALIAAEEFMPAAVFCDIGLPGIDGFEVAARLRADSRHGGIILIAITGWGSAEDHRATQEAGFDFHLVKP
ncbi:MAG: response regulator, partial [Betaproteobacteria bacterium]